MLTPNNDELWKGLVEAIPKDMSSGQVIGGPAGGQMGGKTYVTEFHGDVSKLEPLLQPNPIKQILESALGQPGPFFFKFMFKDEEAIPEVDVRPGGVNWVEVNENWRVSGHCRQVENADEIAAMAIENRDLRAEVLTLRARVAELESAARPAETPARTNGDIFAALSRPGNIPDVYGR